MAGAIIILPIAALAAVGLAAAAASKKKQAAAAPGAGTPEAQAGAAAGAAAADAAANAGITPAQMQATAMQQANAASMATGGQVPADVMALVLAAMRSQNPATMRRAADQLQAMYPDAANDLRKTADAIDLVVAQQQAQKPPAASVGLPTVAPTLPQQAQGGPAGVPTAVNVPSVLPQASPMIPMPTPSAIPPNIQQTSAAKALAQRLALSMKTAIKGKEDKVLVKQFQIAERLPRTDGSYGSESALALADRYGIVPPKPLYWGKAGGTYQTLVNDKNQYKAHLLNLANSDPQRADEWVSASKV